MQKKLLTLAVAGALTAPGLALAQVEVYGFVNMSVGQFKYSEPTQVGVLNGVGSVSKMDVASHASNYGIRGRESIGGGQTMWFQIEQNAPMERSNNVAITPASRNSAVGIQGGWGNVFIGQWTTPWADLDALWGVGSVGGWGPITSIIGRRETTGSAPLPNCVNGHTSPAPSVCDAVEAGGGVGHAFWRRASQSVHYQSPVFSGFQGKVMYQTNDGKSTTTNGGTIVANPSMFSASVTWAGMGGRVRVGAAIDSHKEFTTQGKTDSGYRITGGWNFGFMDVGLAYEAMTYKATGGDCDAKQYGVGVAIPVGQGAIRASYAIAKDIKGEYVTATPINPGGFGATTCALVPAAVVNDVSDNGAKTWTIGYEHRFSKRSSVGFGYAAIENDPASVLTWTGAPTTQTGGGAGIAGQSVANTPLPGSDPSTFFVNFLHRF